MEKQVPGLTFQAPTPVDTDTDKVVFVGWDNGLAKDGKGTVPEGNTTYTAQYKADLNNDGTPDEEQYVDVTFEIAEVDGSKGKLEGETSYQDLVPGLELTVPTVEDTIGDEWAFDGWEPALTEVDKKVLVPSSDTNYVATWKEDKNGDNTPDEDQYVTLTFESTYGFEEGDSPRRLENQVPGLTFQAPTPVDTETDNVVFVGWNNSLADNGIGIVPIVSTTYMAQYKADLNNDGIPDEEQYVDVTFAIAESDATKGTLEGTTSYTDLVPGLELTVPTVVDTEGDDWVFDGWNPMLEENPKVPDESTLYTVVFKEDKNHDGTPDDKETKYTITYAAGADDDTIDGIPTAVEVLKNTEQTVSNVVPTREKFVFTGWTTTDVTVTDGKFMMPAKDVTFTATWKADDNEDGKPDENQTLTIVFNAGDGSFKEGVTSSYTLLPGDNYPAAPGAEDLNAPEGMAFDGWTPAYTLSGKVPADQSTDSLNYVAAYSEDTNGNGEPDKDERYNLTINYEYVSGEGDNAPSLPNTYTERDLEVGYEYRVESPVIEGYVARPQVVSGTIYDRDVEITVYYHADSNGNGEPDSEESYSLTINYGYVSSEGTSAPQLPATYRVSGLEVGYEYNVPSPEIEGYVARPLVVSGTIYNSNVTATVYYYVDSNGNGVPDTEEPATPDPGTPGGGQTTPDDNTPDTPGTGGGAGDAGDAGDTDTPAAGAGAATGTGTGTVRRAPADAADTDADDDAAEADDYDLTEIGEDENNDTTTIDEDETPLGNKVLDDADADNHGAICILHWLILLLAVVITVFFILDGNRLNRKINDLEDDLKERRNQKTGGR